MGMTATTYELYRLAKNDETFLKEIYEADGDKKPGLFSDNETKTLFATIYYGWLVGKGLWEDVKNKSKLWGNRLPKYKCSATST